MTYYIVKQQQEIIESLTSLMYKIARIPPYVLDISTTRHMTLALVEHRTYFLSNSLEHGLRVMIGEALLLKTKNNNENGDTERKN